MATVDSGQLVDEVQTFDVTEAMKKRDQLSGRVDMARSPNSFIAVFQTRPRGGETHIHQHPDSDQILFILDGELTVESLSGRFTLTAKQGVIPVEDNMRVQLDLRPMIKRQALAD